MCGYTTATVAAAAIAASTALPPRRKIARPASASMAPLIQPGDALCLAPLGVARPRLGAIVAYVRDARLVVHRVVAATPGGVVTRGDGLPEADAPLEWT